MIKQCNFSKIDKKIDPDFQYINKYKTHYYNFFIHVIRESLVQAQLGPPKYKTVTMNIRSSFLFSYIQSTYKLRQNEKSKSIKNKYHPLMKVIFGLL